MYQTGYRLQHSTESALLKISKDLLLAADSGDSSPPGSQHCLWHTIASDHPILLEKFNGKEFKAPYWTGFELV